MKNKGITLVALVITIIILLILAGITISTLTETGLLKKTQEAKERTNEAIQKEENEIEKLEKEIEEIKIGNSRENNNGYKYIGQILNFTYKTDGTEPGHTYYLECDLSKYIENYKNRTIDDFVIEMNNLFVDRQDHVTNTSFNYEYRYNQENGILQVYAYGGWFYYIRPTEFKLYIK